MFFQNVQVVGKAKSWKRWGYLFIFYLFIYLEDWKHFCRNKLKNYSVQRTCKTKKIYSFMHKLNIFFLILIYLFSFNFFYNFEHIFYSCFYTTKQEENNTNFLIFYFFLIIQFEKKKDLYILYSFSFLIFLFLYFFSHKSNIQFSI